MKYRSWRQKAHVPLQGFEEYLQHGWGREIKILCQINFFLKTKSPYCGHLEGEI